LIGNQNFAGNQGHLMSGRKALHETLTRKKGGWETAVRAKPQLQGERRLTGEHPVLPGVIN